MGALGRGVGLKRCGGVMGRRLIYSVPDELNSDQAMVLNCAANAGGKTSSEDLVRLLKWDKHRAEATLAFFVRAGFRWVDTQDGTVSQWCWFPSMALSGQEQPSESSKFQPPAR